jgi:hypothetical protein
MQPLQHGGAWVTTVSWHVARPWRQADARHPRHNVDILGRAGRLEEAYAMVTSMEPGNGSSSNQLQQVNHY